MIDAGQLFKKAHKVLYLSIMQKIQSMKMNLNPGLIALQKN